MNSENSPFKVSALNSFDKTIAVPASKSHSNRALILGAIRGGGFKVHNLSSSTDVTNLLKAFKSIGLNMEMDGSSVTFRNAFPECEKDTKGEIIELHTGDGGTTNRFLMALLARGKKEYHFYPTEKMSERPIEDLVKPLKKLGVDVHHQVSGSPWVRLKGPATMYNTTKLEVDCQKSTQFASALMLAFSNLPLKFEFMNLHASETYLNMTAEVIKASLQKNTYVVPVDFSSLGYPAALAALMGKVVISNCHGPDPLQADTIFLDMLKSSGAEVSFSAKGLEIAKGFLRPFSFNVAMAPDLFPTLVFLAAHIDGESTFSNLDILAYKESDRLDEMMKLMRVFGVQVEHSKSEDVLRIKGSATRRYSQAVVSPARDHRIVMTAALFMMKNSGGELSHLDCVEKSFPHFLTLLG